MTTFQYTLYLNDSEYMTLENLLSYAIRFQETELAQRGDIKMEYIGLNQCKAIQEKLTGSIKDAVMASTSSFCK